MNLLFNKITIKEKLSETKADESFYDTVCEDLNTVFHLALVNLLIERLSEEDKNILKNLSLEEVEYYFSEHPEKIPSISDIDIATLKESIFNDYMKSVA